MCSCTLVRARDGSDIGILSDVVVRIDDRSYPPISGIVVRDQRRAMFIPATDIVAITHSNIALNTMQLNLQRFSRRDGEVLLNKDVLDHQIVGRQVISWADAQYLASAAPVQLKVSYNRLNDMSAVDLARIVDALSYRESAEIVAALDDETAAETLEEVSDERMADLLEGMDQERAADILEEMTPSAAADALEDLDADVAEQILARMEPEEAEDVKELLAYDGDSVGRSMTTDLVVAYPDDRVEDVIRGLRAREELPDPLTEIYVVEHHDVEEGMDGFGARLIGIVRIPKLLVTGSDVPLRDILEEVPTIHVDDPSENAARVLGEYNLTAVPVVDSDGMLVGAVSVDDALAVLLPDIWHRRGSRNFG